MGKGEQPVLHLGGVDVSPGEVGFIPEKVDQLDAYFLRLVEQEKVQCASYLLARYGKVFACKSMGGLSAFDDSTDFMPDSIRQVYSITKAFTAIAILRLVEEGKIYLEQPVASIIEEFDTPIHRSILILHLLTHTSGICPDPGYYCEPYPRDGWGSGNDANWIKNVLKGPLACTVGEAWIYSSAGFTILGEIVSRITGVPYEEYVMQRILAPLDMHRSFFSIPRALLDQVCAVNEWEHKKLREEDQPNRPPMSAGGLSSTLPNLFRLGQMLLNKGTLDGKRAISRKAVEAMTRNQLCGVPAFYWGAGFKSYAYGLGLHLAISDLLSPGVFNHEGYGRSCLYVDPAEQFMAIYFVPSVYEWLPEVTINPRGIIWSGLT